MSKNMHDIRTLGFVIRRTNYQEADRILNIITPSGKVSAIAKGVRREKSKLAGNIELFSRIDFNIHRGKNDLGVVTGAKMLKFFSNILKDYHRMEFAGELLKRVNALAENSDNSEYYYIVDQVMTALDSGINLELIKTWTILALKKSSGEEINLYRDIDGNELSADKTYTWDFYEASLKEDQAGTISCDEIKLMRLILTNKLSTVAKVKNIDDILPSISQIVSNL